MARAGEALTVQPASSCSPASPPAVTAAGAPHLFLCRAPPQPSFLSDFKSQQPLRQINEPRLPGLALLPPYKLERQGVPPGSGFEDTCSRHARK